MIMNEENTTIQNVNSDSVVVLGGNEENTNTYILLDKSQFDILVDSINTGSSSIVSAINNIDYDNDSIISREDLDYFIDIQTQQVFFISLIFGVLVAIIFVLGLKK